MKRAVMVLGALGVLALPVAAQDAVSDHIGMIGFGYFSPAAPLGVRHWTSPTLGFDAGIGVKAQNKLPILEDGEAHTTSFFDFAFEAGVLIALRSDENMILFVRPGLAFESAQELVPTEVDSLGRVVSEKKDSATTFALSVMLGAELFLGKLGFPNLSLGGGHGVRLASESPAGEEESSTTIGSTVADVSIVSNTELGFHFYF